MKKNISLWMLGIAAMLASCSQDEELLQGATDGLQPVTIAVSLEDADGYAVRTRSILDPNLTGEDEAVTRCLMEVVENGTSKELVTLEGSQATGFTATLELDGKNSYQFLFWADAGEDRYTITDAEGERLQNIVLPAISEIGRNVWKPTIAYRGYAEWDKTGTVSVTLTHAVAKITLKTTSDLQSGDVIGGFLAQASPCSPKAYSGDVPLWKRSGCPKH